MISPERLRRYPYFAGVTQACLKEVAMISDEQSFKADEKIFQESGDFLATDRIYQKAHTANHLMIITEGAVDITYTLGEGQKVVVGNLVAGDLMAVSALIPPYHLTASAVAKQDGKLIAIEAEALRKLCEENPGLGYKVMQGVSKAIMNRLQTTRVELAGVSSS
jgi:CRP-like cAMP-binding protein